MKTICSMVIAIALSLLMVMKLNAMPELEMSGQALVTILVVGALFLYCILGALFGAQEKETRALNHIESMVRRQHARHH